MNQDTSLGEKTTGFQMNKGIVFFFAGVLMMIGMIFIGYSIEDDLASYGLKVMEERRDPVMGLVLLFAFGFPLGMVITLVGALLISNISKKSVITYFMIGFMLVILAALVPLIFGKESSGAYFGTGGMIIMTSIVISFWYWAQYRSTLQIYERKSTDFQALGYLCFGLAAWNTCGFASMPSFALFPEVMIEQGMRPFAVGQAKAIMAYFVLGWLFTTVSMYLKAKTNR